MDILLINQYAGTPAHGMELRPYYLARRWVAAGHRVTIVAASFTHLRRLQPEITAGFSSADTIDGIDYRWIRTPTYRGNGAARVANIMAFVGSLSVGGPRSLGLRRPDAIIASSTHPLDIWPSMRLARRFNAGLIFEVHDLWPLTPIELGGYSPNHPYIRVLQRSEDAAYRHADRVVSLLPDALPYMVSRGMPSEKFVHIPNGLDGSDWDALNAPLPEHHEVAIGDLRRRVRTIVGYAGSHGLSNSLETLVDAAGLVQNRGVGLVLVGDGPSKSDLVAMVRDRQLQNVIFLPPVARAALPRLLSRFDMACLCWRDRPLYHFGISPNKLLDYMAAGLPVIHATGAPSDPVRDSGCGASIEPGNARRLAEAMTQLADLSADQRRTLGERGRAHVRARLDYRVLADQFIDVLRDAADIGQRRAA